VYAAVRESFHLLALDDANYGTAQWNPLGDLIHSGDRVLLKPNFVLHRNFGQGPLEAVVTHGAVIRAVADYALLALAGKGMLTIGDAPQMNCDLDTLFRGIGMHEVCAYLERQARKSGVEFRMVDFRQEQTQYKFGIVWKRRKLSGGEGTRIVQLGRESHMEGIDAERLYGADYARQTTIKAHLGHRHEYCIAVELLQADVVISMPKLKVHSKVGTTLNVKNMVGVNTDKNHLAHYRIGPRERGGDEFSNPAWDDVADRVLMDRLLGRNWAVGKYPFVAWRVVRRLITKGRRPANRSFVHGNWHGNDTAWRMALDLNEVVLAADRDGKLHKAPVRRYFSVIDGIVAGQGDGPLHPDAYAAGAIVAGFNPLAVDWIATLAMGFDPKKIPMYQRGAEQMQRWHQQFDPSLCRALSNNLEWQERLASSTPIFRFEPAPGWKGMIETARA
jgi:uncharacterized protein (DUF362 family)